MIATFGFRSPVSRVQKKMYAVLAMALIFAAWLAYAGASSGQSAFIPSPRSVAEAAVRMLRGGFVADIGASVARILGAFVISALLAIPIGVAMSSYKSIGAGLKPLIEFVRYVPVPALLPLFILWGGIGETSKFLVLFVGTFFQLVLLVRDDADDVPAEYFDLAQTLGAAPRQLLGDVLVPALLPKIYDRLRVTLGWCWTYLVIAELIAVERGIGHVLKEAQRFSAADQMFVCFLVLGAIGLLTDVVAEYGYDRIFPHIPKAKRS